MNKKQPKNWADLSVKTKISIGFAVVLLLHISIVVIAHLEMRKTDREFTEYEKQIQQVNRINEIGENVSNLEMCLQLFARDGIQSTQLDIYDSFAEIQSRIQEAILHAELSCDREKLERMLEHLRDQRRYFHIVVQDRERCQELSTVRTKQLHMQFEQGIQDLQDTVDANEVDALVQAAIGAMYHYISHPDSVHFRTCQQKLEQALRILDRLDENEKGTARQKIQRVRKSVQDLKSVAIQVVQSTRSYLHLINVVLAGEGFEFRYIASTMAEQHLLRIDRLAVSMAKERQKTQAASVWFSLATVLLALLAASLISRSIAPQIRAIADTFSRLTQGVTLADIPFVERRDELGELAKAAQVFRSKAEETERLLLLANQSQEDLKKVNKELENQTIRANQMVVEANAATQAKSDFLANMSHEIRTPMTAILGFTENLAEVVEDPEMEICVKTIRQNGYHLLDIINDILDLSKVEAGKMVAESLQVSPSELLNEVVSLTEQKLVNQGLEFHVQFETKIPALIDTDPTRLKQILLNLLGNAIKFTEQGEVAIQVSWFEEPEPLLQFDVIDTGIGLEQSQAENLFEPFCQADSSVTRRFGGTGLGLAISKRFAKLLGGDLWLEESNPGSGSRFRLRIATGKVSSDQLVEGPTCQLDLTPRRNEISNRKDPLKGFKVLLAEDGPDNQKLISFILKKAGAEVTVVENGELAIENAVSARRQQQAFDCILMDMQMPVLDGYAATGRLREMGFDGVVVALTAHAMAQDRTKCLEAGCDEYLTKPIDRTRLVQLVSDAPQLLREKRQGEQVQPVSQ